MAAVWKVWLPDLERPVGAVRCFARADQVGQRRPVIRLTTIHEALPDESTPALPAAAPIEAEANLLDLLARGTRIDGAPDQGMESTTTGAIGHQCRFAVHCEPNTGRIHVDSLGGVSCRDADHGASDRHEDEKTATHARCGQHGSTRSLERVTRAGLPERRSTQGGTSSAAALYHAVRRPTVRERVRVRDHRPRRPGREAGRERKATGAAHLS